MRSRFGLPALVLLLVPSIGHTAGVVVVPTNFVEEIIVQGLNQPNGMCFLPDGRLLFTEQETGRIRMIVDGHVATTDPCVTVDSVSVGDFERGLQGIAVDPRWPDFPYVYVCYTQLGPREVIARYTASGDLTNPAGENLVLGSKRELIGNIRDQHGNHNGGSVRFGIDGMLYVSLGEDSDRCSAQYPDSLRGCLLRMDVTRIPAGPGGAVPRALLIPPDNPIAGPDSNARLVYAYGLRNPWRFNIDRWTGEIVLGDVGELTKEEIDIIRAGGNYGWPFREGDTLHTQPECLEPGGTGTGSYNPPIVSLGRSTGFTAILGAGFYRPVPGAPSNWPAEYWGDAFFGDFYECRLRRLHRNGATWGYATPVAGQPDPLNWATRMYWAVDFAVGPDGSLWWLKMVDDSFSPISGMVRRIRYVGPTVGVADPARIRATPYAMPNPFRTSVELSLPPDRSGTGRLAIFDLAGREVRELWRGERPGLERVTWDGRDGLGHVVPPGVYLARLERRDGASTVRVLRLP